MFINLCRKLTRHEIKQIYSVCHKYKHTYLLEYIRPNRIQYSNVSPGSLNLTRRIQTNVCLNARIFKDAENDYAYNVLQTIPICDKHVLVVNGNNKAVSTLEDFNSLLDQDWKHKSATEIVEGFKSALNYSIANNINLSDQRFDKLVDGLVDHVQDLTDTELLDLMDCLIEYPLCDSYSAHNFHDIWSALDDVCCWKMPLWSNTTMFQFADRWYRLNLAKFSDYLYNFIDRMQKRHKYLDKNELIHLFFYFRIHKRHKIIFDCEQALDKFIVSMSLQEIFILARAFIYNKQKLKAPTTVACIIDRLKLGLQHADEICISKIIEKHIDTLNADEMAVIAMGFFKSQSPIKLKLLLAPIIAQTKKECQTIHEIALTAILKVLRYSSHTLLIDQLMDLLDHLVPQIDRLSVQSCIHMALLGTTLQFFHEKSLDKVCQKLIRYISNPEEMRLKDIERLLVALTMFDFYPNTNPDIFQAIHKELLTENRRQEYLKYKRCLPSILNFLSMHKLYCYELMDEILCHDTIMEIYGKSPKTLPIDILSLDVGIEIECPDYSGNRLNEKFRYKTPKWFVEYIPTWDQHRKISMSDKFYLTVYDTVSKFVHGSENVSTDHILPNFSKADIIICRDEDNKFIPPVGFESYSLGDVMRPPNSTLKWYAIIPVNWNSMIRNTQKPVGLINRKCRLLKAVGYEPVLVLWNEFVNLPDKDRLEYINCKIT